MANNSNIKQKYENALKHSDLIEIQEIVSELNALSSSDKKLNKDFYAKIEEDLFQVGIEPPNNYDLRKFLDEIANSTSKTSKGIKGKSLIIPGRVKDINDMFCE